jgi:hypothetical protein
MILEKETNGNCSNSFSSGKNHDQIWKCQLLAHGDGTNENHEQILKHKSKFRIYFLFFVFKETQFGSGSFTFPYTLVGIIFSLISISCFFFFFSKLILAVVVVVARSKGVATQFIFTTQHVVGANLTAARFFFRFDIRQK